MKAIMVLGCLLLVASPAITLLSRADQPQRGVVAKASDGKKSLIDAIDKQSLRYDGKSFDEWRTMLFTELKSERQAEALAAIGTFAANGHSTDAIAAIVQFIGKPGRLPTDQKMLDRLVLAAVDAASRAEEADIETMLATAPTTTLAASPANEFWRKAKAELMPFRKVYSVVDLVQPVPGQAGSHADFAAIVLKLKAQFPAGTWSDDGGTSDIEEFAANFSLVIAGPPRLQKAVARMIDEMRQTQAVTREYDVAELVRSRAPDGGIQVDFGALEELLKSTVEPSSWVSAGGAGRIDSDERTLTFTVDQPPHVQRAVSAILEQLRALRKKAIQNSPAAPQSAG